jgi:DtxR family transcriptional regulator, Mn-dependent transcriptional regulator
VARTHLGWLGSHRRQRSPFVSHLATAQELSTARELATAPRARGLTTVDAAELVGAADVVDATALAAKPAGAKPAVVTELLEILLEQALAGADRGGLLSSAALGDAALDPATAVALDALAARLPMPAVDVELAVVALVAAGDAVHVDGGVALTASGRERAATAVRRHRLVERMLSDLIGLEWWKVHHEAVRFEGVISADVEAKLIEQLGDPGTCPHGNPIPGSDNQPAHPDAVLLADAPLGPVHVVRITETLEGDDEALQLLQNCGFLPGRDAEIKARKDGWVEVAGTVHDAAFPHHIAAHTYVAPR